MDVNFLLRLERTRRLAKCDWTQSSDSPLSEEKKKEWATYRQALRDLPANQNPVDMELSNITWPTKPS